MQAVSKRQQRSAERAFDARRGKIPVGKLRGSSLRMYESMNDDQLHQIAHTPTMGLPEKKKLFQVLGRNN